MKNQWKPIRTNKNVKISKKLTFSIVSFPWVPTSATLPFAAVGVSSWKFNYKNVKIFKA